MTDLTEARMPEPHENGKRPLTPRARRYWGSLIGAGLIGAAISILLLPLSIQAGQNIGTGNGNFLDPFLAPINPMLAALIAALWLTGLITMCAVFYRSLDEVEERDYLWAGTIGWYAIMLTIPAWYVLWMGRLAPPVGIWWIFGLGLLTNNAVWMWRKYRK
jgi:hypothetical protein